jgi:hypothetical protein
VSLLVAGWIHGSGIQSEFFAKTKAPFILRRSKKLEVEIAQNKLEWSRHATFQMHQPVRKTTSGKKFAVGCTPVWPTQL